MTSEELIKKIQVYYSEARDSEYSDKQIMRGRKHSISSKVEDLFAYFLLMKLEDPSLEFWVDYPMTFKSTTKFTKKGNPSSVTIYPDIAIVRDGQVEDIIDIKMDLGWKRILAPTLETADARTNEMRIVRDGTYKKVDTNGNKSKENFKVTFSESLNWHIITISDQNISELKMALNEAMVEQNYSETPVYFYVFTRKHHPNGGNPVIQHEEIERLIENLK